MSNVAETVMPYIDPRVEHVGVSKLRSFNASNLGSINKAFVIQDNDTPLAVLLNYEQFLKMQEEVQGLYRTINLLRDAERNQALRASIKDAREGRISHLEDLDWEK